MKVIVDNNEYFAQVGEMLRDGRSVTLRARGNSMFPFITDGRDEVLLRRCTDVAVGDIVLAHLADGRYVLHRVYGITDNRLVLMGDGNLQATESCTLDEVMGCVVEIVRNRRRVDCTSACERRRATLWRRLLPVRRYLLYICRKVRR